MEKKMKAAVNKRAANFLNEVFDIYLKVRSQQSKNLEENMLAYSLVEEFLQGVSQIDETGPGNTNTPLQDKENDR